MLTTKRNGHLPKIVQVIISSYNIISYNICIQLKKIFLDKDSKDKPGTERSAASNVPRLSVCADAQKVDRAKLAQTEVIKYYIYSYVNKLKILTQNKVYFIFILFVL